MALAPANRARLQATLACAGMLFLRWRLPGPATTALVVVAVLFALLAWCSPRHYAPIQRVFDRVVRGLLVALTWTTLALVYFGVFTPLRLWRTISRNDPLRLRRPAGPKPASYLLPLPAAPSRFDRQF